MDQQPHSARRRAHAAALCALAAACALAIAAPGASAVIVHIGDGRTISSSPVRGSSQSQPFDAFFSNLDYNGGPVMPSNTNYPVYWRPSTAAEYPAEYESGVDQFFEDLAHDSGNHENTDSVSSQYNDAAGEFANYDSHYGGALIDTDPYPANGCTQAPTCLTDAQLRAELQSFVKANGLPMDLQHEYFLLTPPKVETCFTAAGVECSAGSKRQSFCAYHSATRVTGGVIVYADDPYVTGNPACDDGNHPNGKPSDGILQGGLVHEHNESITDPEPNNAWTDFGGSGGENGDKCRTFQEGTEYGTPLGLAENGAKYNQLIDGHPYWFQQEWSNQGSECLQRFTLSGQEPTATFTSAQLAGNSVSLDAAGSTAPGGVSHYNWQFNDGPGGTPSTPEETTGPTTTHAFAASGAYTVALTVYAADGASVGTAHTVLAGAAVAPSVTKVTPNKGPVGGGSGVTITGKNLNGATAVKFGSAAVGFSVISSTKIVAVAPEHAAGTVDVTVSTLDGTSPAVIADRYKFLPAVTSVSPASGPAAGGTHVTVTGSGFNVGTGTTVVKFGGAKSPSVTCSSSTSCVAVAPKHAAATVYVLVAVNGVTSVKALAGDQFTWF